jgi:hypothetical protein
MELLRSLGSLIEPPGEETASLVDLLGLGPPPTEAVQTDLFLFQLYPYASVYLDQQGKLGGEARDRIAGFWRALDLVPPAEPDHLTLLLAFYSQLCDRQASADSTDEDRWWHARTAFFWEHLMSWLPLYLDKTVDLAPPFYRSWAELLAAALAEEAAQVPVPDQLPLHLRESTPLEDPRRADSSDFLEALLSPVRSGCILVRDDLRRAGRELGLAVRAGERRYVLEALLGQDDERTLRWLAAESRRWSERPLERFGPAEAIARFWSERAAATAALLEDLAEDL